jgi:hypothetical protein
MELVCYPQLKDVAAYHTIYEDLLDEIWAALRNGVKRIHIRGNMLNIRLLLMMVATSMIQSMSQRIHLTTTSFCLNE